MVDSKKLVEEIVAKVLSEISSKTIENREVDNTFGTVDEAVSEAKKAHEQLKKMTIGERGEIIKNIRRKCLDYAEVLSTMAVDETGMGRTQDKITKHVLVAEKTPGTEDLKTTAWSGDGGLTLIEQGSFGVIAAITPTTNPTTTILCNSIGMIAAGNTVVFAPHPGAVKCSNFAVKLINEASVEAGGPNNIVVSFKKPSIEATSKLMSHKDVTLITATGGPGVVHQALSSGTRAIGAGAGNPPVLVDCSADIKKAAKDIIDGATFDNNLPCIAEKEVIAIDSICNELIHHMVLNGAYLLTDREFIKKLEDLVLIKKGNSFSLNRNYVGRDAKKILDAIGISVDDSIKCIILEGSKDDLLVKEELMMPILGIVRAKSFEEAVKFAIELEHGNRHSAHIHSRNIDNLTTFAKSIDTAILVKNAPSYSALGVNAEGYATFTIASKTGEGLTSAKTFTKNRRCVLSDSLSIR